MPVTLKRDATKSSDGSFQVLDDGQALGELVITPRMMHGYLIGQVRHACRYANTLRKGQFAQAYVLAMEAMQLDVLESDALMSKYAVALWQRMKAPPGWNKVFIMATEPMSPAEPESRFSDYWGEHYECRPESRIWCLVREGKEEFIAHQYLKFPEFFDVREGMHLFEEPW